MNVFFFNVYNCYFMLLHTCIGNAKGTNSIFSFLGPQIKHILAQDELHLGASLAPDLDDEILEFWANDI